MATVIEIDALTGETVERDFTPEEQTQRDLDAAEHATRKAAQDFIDGNRATIESQASAALAANRTYIALAAPTNAQVAAQVKALTRQNQGIIRLLLNLLDATD